MSVALLNVAPQATAGKLPKPRFGTCSSGNRHTCQRISDVRAIHIAVAPRFLTCEITPKRIIGTGLGHAPGQRSSSRRRSAPSSWLPFAAAIANVRLGEGFLMRVAAARCALARPRPALENLPRWKLRGAWILLWGKCAVGWVDRCTRGAAEGAHDASYARTLGGGCR